MTSNAAAPTLLSTGASHDTSGTTEYAFFSTAPGARAELCAARVRPTRGTVVNFSESSRDWSE
jgi:hypothetical protein